MTTNIYIYICNIQTGLLKTVLRKASCLLLHVFYVVVQCYFSETLRHCLVPCSVCFTQSTMEFGIQNCPILSEGSSRICGSGGGQDACMPVVLRTHVPWHYACIRTVYRGHVS